MPWFKVDDTLSFHAKTLAAGNAAMGLWVRAGSWSMQTLSDGFIPEQVAKQIGSRSEISKLITSGLWREVSGGFEFHEWNERQPTRDKVLSERSANSERIKAWRDKKAKERETNV